MDGTVIGEKVADDILKRGKIRLKKTTKGHHMLLKWKVGRSTWNALKVLQYSCPEQMATYAIENGLDKEPAYI